MNEDERAILAEARKVLETDGWIQGSQYRDGKHCAIGAMHFASMRLWDPIRNDYRHWNEARSRASFATRAHLKRSVSAWNDESGRTVEDVIQLFKEVERELEGPDSAG